MNNTVKRLDGTWELYLAPNKEVRAKSFSASDAESLAASGFCHISAEVPGNFELDLQRAGLLPDLFFGTNPTLAQKEENKHLWYTRTFELDSLPTDDTYLRFDGIDTFAEIFLNGVKIGESDNMLIEHEFKALSLKTGTNEIVVHITPTAIKMREFDNTVINSAQAYHTDSINVRKAGYMFGWDIMARFVSGGLWKSVSLITKPKNRLEDIFITTVGAKFQSSQATLLACMNLRTDEDFLDEFRIVIKGHCGDAKFEKEIKPWNVNVRSQFLVGDCKYWWPRNKGEQNLYDVEVDLYLRGELCDRQNIRIGIRTVELDRTSVIDRDGKGKFEFIINGQKTFILGTNWVPLDQFPSQNEKHLDAALALVDDIGCNMIRCWGGNVYENDRFYELCDERGILVWQDFGMGCALYPQNEDFCRALEKEAILVVKRLRNHACITVWAGDNECDYNWNFAKFNGENVLTRKVLPAVVTAYDPYHPYLPSSPYIDKKTATSGLPLSEDHLWGPRDYFKGQFYSKAVSAFASETGYHGCPSPSSLKKFIGEDYLWPNLKENGHPNDHWLIHGTSIEVNDEASFEYRTGLMNRQVVELFGTPTRNNKEAMSQLLEMFGDDYAGLCEYAKASQISQAEAFKYFIERFRIRKDVRGGIIWWNIRDGWPQTSDAVVDYYNVKKLAYGYIRNSQAPVCLMFDEPENDTITLFAANEFLTSRSVEYKVTRFSDGQVVLCGKCEIGADGLLALGSVPTCEDEHEFYLIEWTDDKGVAGRNHYVTNIRGVSYDAYKEFLNNTRISEYEGF